MRKRRVYAIFVIILIFACNYGCVDNVYVTEKSSLGMVIGRIVEQTIIDNEFMYRGVDNIDVSLSGTKLKTQSKKDGSFSIADVPPGTYYIHVSTSVERQYFVGEAQTVTVIPGEPVNIPEIEITTMNYLIVYGTVFRMLPFEGDKISPIATISETAREPFSEGEICIYGSWEGSAKPKTDGTYMFQAFSSGGSYVVHGEVDIRYKVASGDEDNIVIYEVSRGDTLEKHNVCTDRRAAFSQTVYYGCDYYDFHFDLRNFFLDSYVRPLEYEQPINQPTRYRIDVLLFSDVK